MNAFGVGRRREFGTKSWTVCRPGGTPTASSTGSCSASTAVWCERTRQQPEREKKGPPEEPADHALGRSRGGFGTKLHVVCDSDGWLVSVLVSPGQVHESTQFEDLMESIEVRSLRGPAKRRPARVVGDKAYSAEHIRDWLSSHRIEDVIPHRDNEAGCEGPFDRDSYRSRNIIERTIGWLKEFRRIATRYEKLAVHYLGMIKLGMILQYLTY
jgi:transposase